MNVFDVREFASAVRSLSNTARNFECRRAMGQGAMAISQNDQVALGAYCTVAHEFCVKHQFNDGVAKTRDTLRAIDPRMRGSAGPSIIDYSWAAAELKGVCDVLVREADKFKFILVPQDRAAYLDTVALFGEAVDRAYPSAKDDICEAGNCLAAGCNTAGVFHLMRAVEWALRSFCLHLGFKEVKNKWNKKTKRYCERIPVEYATWERILAGLKPAIDAMVNRIRRKDDKQRAQEFYLTAWQEIDAIKDAWRNHVMHTRSRYSAGDANVIMEHVKRLMISLATKLGES